MSKPPKRRAIRYRRRLSPESRYTIRLYGQITAETIWAWNRLHSILFELFLSFLGTQETSYGAAYAIWHTFQSDSTQREMIRHIARRELSPRSRQLSHI